jgi:hypothetical protein
MISVGVEGDVEPEDCETGEIEAEEDGVEVGKDKDIEDGRGSVSEASLGVVMLSLDPSFPVATSASALV